MSQDNPTVSTLIDTTLDRHLTTDDPPILNLLDGSHDDSTTTISFKHPVPNSQAYSIVLEIDSELLYVLSPSDDHTLNVIRGYRNTEPTSHDDNSLVTFSPRFPRINILKALRDDILSWPSTLFRTVEEQHHIYTHSPTNITIEDSTFLHILKVYYTDFPSISPTWHTTTTRDSYGNPKSLLRIHPRVTPGKHHVTDKPSSATDITILYAAHFYTGGWEESTTLSSMGLSRHMTDIPPLGAAWRLLSGVDARFSNLNTTHNLRTEEAVQPGPTTELANTLKALRDQRIQEETKRLNSFYRP